MPSYDFYCSEDNHTESRFCHISEYDEMLKEAVCPVCGKPLKRDISGIGGVKIPEHMKAGDATFDTAKRIMTRGSRPSGRDKIFY